jgi:hypothetical protein
MQTPSSIISDHFGTAPFIRRQAESAGVSRQQLNRLVRSHQVTHVLYGVYRIGDEPMELFDRARAAALVIPPESAVARRTAAWLLGVDTRPPDERTRPMAVECIVPRGRTPVRRPSIRCYQADLDVTDLMQIDGLRSTTPTRTTADLLRWLSPPMGLAGADALAAAKLIDPDEVSAMLHRWPGHRFVEQARRLCSWIEPLTESFAESWLRLRILDAGFPRPVAQIPILDAHGRLTYRLDLGWPERRIGIEYDGDEFHASQTAREADFRRRERLRKEFGWHVVGVGRGEVLGRKLDLERGVGELLGLEPLIRRRTW